MQVLSRRTKNNPVLIGEPGVGKTAIVEGLAQRIVANDVPETLQGQAALHPRPRRPGGRQPLPRRLRGAPEEGAEGDPHPRRHRPVHRRAAHPGRAPGAAEGAIDAASILKPMLARGELQTIGATTLDEYRKHLEKDAALERRFQPIKVEQPTVAHTIEILKGLRDRYESHHAVTITDQALVAAANLADRYLADRYLPDKAIDLIDEAGSRLRIRRMTTPPDYKKLEDEIDRIRTRQGGGHRAPGVRPGEEARRAGEGAPRPQDGHGGRVARRGRRPVRRGRRGGHRRGAGQLDRHPRLPAHRGGDGQAAAHGGRAAQAGHRPGRRPSRPCRGPSAAPGPGSRTPSGPSGSFIFLGPDRGREDRAGQDAGRVPLRRRGRPDPARHERVHGEAHRVAAWSARPPATSATKRAAS